MKLIVIPKSKEMIDKYINLGVNSFIIGLKDLSINFDLEMNIDEIKELNNKYSNLDLFISINKNIFNDELNNLENSLIELDKLNIKGVLFYDLSIVYLKNKNNLKLDLVWNQNHMVTNYNTCNYYYSKGVKYALIAPEITLEEIKEIKDKSSISLITFGFGYPIMADSRRKLITNYFKSINKESDKDSIEIYDEKNRFIVKEDRHGTTFFNKEFLNGVSLIKEDVSDYIVYSDQFVDEDKSIEITKLILNLLNNYKEEYVDSLNNLIGNDTNFLFKKTIYMVKRNDK